MGLIVFKFYQYLIFTLKVIDILMALEVRITEEDRDYWGDAVLEYEMVMDMEERYDLCIDIWTQSLVNGFSEYHIYYNGDKCGRKEVSLHYQHETERLILISDTEKYFAGYFVCRNRESKCIFTFRSKKLRDQHELLCAKERIKIVQTEMGPSGSLIEKAEKTGLIPTTEHRRDFLFYDIEAVLPKSSVKTSKTTVLSRHSVVSIAVNR